LGGRAPLQLSADTWNILKLAQEVNRAAGGAFDVTLGNPQGLVLNENNRTVRYRQSLAPSNVEGTVDRRLSTVDLGGIGKGYAVESARRLLLNKGVKSAIIDAHSSIAVIGNGWRVGIRDPREGKEEEGVGGIIILNDGDALATSGQYEQPGHIIDPRTGRTAERSLSVTVVAKDAALADALSTAVFVLGPVDGVKLLRKFSAGYFIIDRNGTRYDSLSPKLR
jgi:thiamine biosynthesis lipoprotein